MVEVGSAAQAGASCTDVTFMAGMLISGSINTVLVKEMLLINTTTSHTMHTDVVYPWFITMLMFLGETLALFLSFVLRIYRKGRKHKENNIQAKRIQAHSTMRIEHSLTYDEAARALDTSLGEMHKAMMSNFPPTLTIQSERQFGEEPSLAVGEAIDVDALLDPKPSWIQPILIIPAILDMLSTTLSNAALIYVNVSVYQSMKGGVIVFSALLARICLRRKLLGYQVLGIVIVTVGLAIVGISTIINDNTDSDDEVLVGIALLLVGEMFTGMQYTIEETFVKKRDLPSSQVVASEGIVGLIISIALFPALLKLDGDLNEHDYLDPLKDVVRNTRLLILCVCYLVGMAVYNTCAILVTKKLSAVYRTMIDALRVGLVWAIVVALYYLWAPALGESVNYWSILQLFGVALLYVGVSLHHEYLRIDCCVLGRQFMQYDREVYQTDDFFHLVH